MGFMKRTVAWDKKEAIMEEDRELRTIIIAAAVITALQLVREPEIAIRLPRIQAAIGDGIARARAVASRVRILSQSGAPNKYSGVTCGRFRLSRIDKMDLARHFGLRPEDIPDYADELDSTPGTWRSVIDASNRS